MPLLVAPVDSKRLFKGFAAFMKVAGGFGLAIFVGK
jgi:hypothetical protein